jgi:hypothetical protein
MGKLWQLCVKGSSPVSAEKSAAGGGQTVVQCAAQLNEESRNSLAVQEVG